MKHFSLHYCVNNPCNSLIIPNQLPYTVGSNVIAVLLDQSTRTLVGTIESDAWLSHLFRLDVGRLPVGTQREISLLLALHIDGGTFKVDQKRVLSTECRCRPITQKSLGAITCSHGGNNVVTLDRCISPAHTQHVHPPIKKNCFSFSWGWGF